MLSRKQISGHALTRAQLLSRSRSPGGRSFWCPRLRSLVSTCKLGELKRHALASGISSKLVHGADYEYDPKKAVVNLVIMEKGQEFEATIRTALSSCKTFGNVEKTSNARWRAGECGARIRR